MTVQWILYSALWEGFALKGSNALRGRRRRKEEGRKEGRKVRQLGKVIGFWLYSFYSMLYSFALWKLIWQSYLAIGLWYYSFALIFALWLWLLATMVWQLGRAIGVWQLFVIAMFTLSNARNEGMAIRNGNWILVLFVIAMFTLSNARN